MKYNMELLRTGTGDHLEDLTLMKLAYDRIDGLMDRIEMLTSGPGGIMEMKQTISNKEDEIARLKAALRYYAKEYENPFGDDDSLIARKALEGKDD